MAQPVPAKAFPQPAKAAAMYTAPHAETHPPPPIPPFLLAQNHLQNRLRQAVTCSQSCMTSTLIKGLILYTNIPIHAHMSMCTH